MNFYLLFGSLAIILLVIKGLFLCFVPHGRIPAFFERSLRYIPPAVLAALVAPSILYARGIDGPMLSFPRIAAGAIAFGFALKTRNIIITIVTGMVMLWLFSYLAG